MHAWNARRWQPDATADDGAGEISPYPAALLQATITVDEDLNAILIKAADSVFRETNGEQKPEYRVALTKPLYLVAQGQRAG